MASTSEWQALSPSKVRAECKRLQAVQLLLSEMWHSEVHTYENSTELADGTVSNIYDGSKSPAENRKYKVGLKSPFETNPDTSILSSTSFVAHRNRPNCQGTINDEIVFPYHSALYPLLDCYDSVRDDAMDSSNSAIKSPSKAPLPFHANGHRRSKFSPRLDPHGFEIAELAALEGHLPNSASAIKVALMPKNRKDKFTTFMMQEECRDESNDEHNSQERPIDNGDAVLQEQNNDRRKPRFWTFLMHPISEDAPIHVSDMSIMTVEDHDYLIEFDEEEGSDDEDDGWEEVDDADDCGNEDNQPALSPEEQTQKARHARDFTFLKWWERDIVMERRGQNDLPDLMIEATTEKYSPENIYTSKHAAAFVLLKVFKHALSDLQRDFRLARGVVLLITDWRLCDDDEHGNNNNNTEKELNRDNASLKSGSATSPCTAENEGGIECLRRILAIASSEYVSCDGYCHEWYLGNGGLANADGRVAAGAGDAAAAAFGDDDSFEDDEDHDNLGDSEDVPNHYCSDWWEFLGSLSTLLSYGITHMTEQHANIISAFANNEIGSASGFSASLGNGKIPFEDQKRKTFDEEAPAESDGTFAKENQGDNGAGNVCESRQKTYLKQNIFFQNNAEYDDDDDGDRQQDKVGPQIHIHLLLTILCALRQHAISDRMRLKRLLEKSTSPDTTNKQHHIMSMDISEALDSFNNSVRAIVDIGERILLRLPTNSHSCRLGGMVVRGLLEAYLDSDILASRKNHSMAYMAYEEGSKLKSLVDPLRYAYSVSNAAESPQLDPKKDRNQNSKTGIEDSTSASQLIGTQPPKDVQDVVKALFMRDLVDFQTSGCGFGDFLCWCNLPIYPQPMLFDYISNFPDVNSNDEEDGGEPEITWVEDEDGNELNHAHLSARYDFSLLVFLRQWHLPWTPKSHLSFQIPFRHAISTLALCAHRYGMPSDVVGICASFLPRSWWPDAQRCCWCRNCQWNSLRNQFQDKIADREPNAAPLIKPFGMEKCKQPTPLITCQGCNVAMVCSKEHLKYLLQDGHKRYCGLPPFRSPFSEEDNALCREVLGKDDINNQLENENAKDDNKDRECIEEEEDEGDDNDDGSWESVKSDEGLEHDKRTKNDQIFSFFNEKSYKFQQREAHPFSNLY